MDVIRDIFVGVLTSSIVAGLLIFFLKQYLVKWIDHEFAKRTTLLEHRLGIARKVDGRIVDAQLGVYPEIVELTYRLRNIIRDGMKENAGFKWDHALRPLTIQLTENMFKYRIFLPEELFEKLHEFKRIAQDAVLLVDVQTRDERLFDAESHAQQVNRFQSRFARTDQLFLEIQAAVKEKIRSLQETS